MGGWDERVMNMANEITEVRKKLPRSRQPEAGAGEVAIMEFQSPTAALIARPIPFTSRITVWIIAAMFSRQPLQVTMNSLNAGLGP